MKSDRLDELLLGFEEDLLSPGEMEELSALLEASPEARTRLVGTGVLRETAVSHLTVLSDSEKMSAGTKGRRSSWFQWRPMTAAAAGILIGLFGSSLLVGGSGGVQRFLLPIANPGFETAEELPQVNLVPTAGQWSGLDTEIVTGGGERPKARNGQQMLRLGPAPEGKGYFASVMADLTESRPGSFGRSKKIEVTARFHASEAGRGEHYLLAASTFAETPSAIPDLWESNWRMMTTSALSSTHRAIFPTADETGWQTITVEVEVPLQARTLVITLGSNTPGPVSGRTDHYMDDIEASWIVLDSPSPESTPR